MHTMGPGELSETTIYASLINIKVCQKISSNQGHKKYVYYHNVSEIFKHQQMHMYTFVMSVHMPLHHHIPFSELFAKFRMDNVVG